MVVRPQGDASTRQPQELLLVAPDRRTRRLWLAGCQHVLMAMPLADSDAAPAATPDSLSVSPSEPSATIETVAVQPQPAAKLELSQERQLPNEHPSHQQEPTSAPRDLFDWVEPEAQLRTCKMPELRKRAADNGCDEDAIEDARDASDPKAALIALIMNSVVNSASNAQLHPRPKYPWMQLSIAMREAAGVLGYTEDRWPSHPNDEGGSWPHWDELSDIQKNAAGVLGIKAKDWHSEKLYREIEVVYVDPGRLGIGFAKDTVPLRVSSLVGKSQGRGVEVGMWLSKVQGQEALCSGSFTDAVAQLAAHATRRPLALAFANVA